jgi:hypothetical protein
VGNLLVETSNEFWAKEPVKLSNHRSLEGSEWQPGWAKKLLRADVAGADDVEPGKIIGTMVSKGDASSIQHLQKKIPNQTVCLFDFIEEEDTLLMF